MLAKAVIRSSAPIVGQSCDSSFSGIVDGRQSCRWLAGGFDTLPFGVTFRAGIVEINSFEKAKFSWADLLPSLDGAEFTVGVQVHPRDVQAANRCRRHRPFETAIARHGMVGESAIIQLRLDVPGCGAIPDVQRNFDVGPRRRPQSQHGVLGDAGVAVARLAWIEPAPVFQLAGDNVSQNGLHF